MKSTVISSAVFGVALLSTTALAQTAQVPTSEAVAGSYEVPLVIIPSTSVPAETSGGAIEFGSSQVLSISVSASSVADVVESFPTEQDNLLNLVALTALSSASPGGAESALNVGAETANLPAVGTAAFTGSAQGTVVTDKSVATVSGDVNIGVDFGTGAVNSAFTNMTQQVVSSDPGQGSLGVSEWRDFSSAGSIADGTSLFSGAASTDDGLLTGAVAGSITGTTSVDGLWSLTGAGETAVGAFEASAQ